MASVIFTYVKKFSMGVLDPDEVKLLKNKLQLTISGHLRVR